MGEVNQDGRTAGGGAPERELEELRRWVAAAEESARLAKKALYDAEARIREESDAEERARWLARWEGIVRGCEGRFFTSCNGRLHVWVAELVNADAVLAALAAAGEWRRVDWHSPELQLEFRGLSLYVAEKAYDEYAYGRWDASDGGTVFLPFLERCEDGSGGVWEEESREEFEKAYMVWEAGCAAMRASWDASDGGMRE